MESELHHRKLFSYTLAFSDAYGLADQGNVQILSKFWMPLDEFTEQTMQGLLRGDREIFPLHQEVYDKVEKPRQEVIEERAARMAALRKQAANS